MKTFPLASFLAVTLSLAGLSCALLPAADAFAATAGLHFESDPAKSEVQFTAIGRPSALKIVGKGTGASGKFDERDGKTQGQIDFDLDSLKTGIEMRDHHMKEKYLEVGKFPKSTLKLETLNLPKEGHAEKFAAESVPFTGKLTLHGKENPVSGTAKITRDGPSVDALANFTIKLTDYGVDIPKFAGITVAEDVQVQVDLQGKLTTTSPGAAK